MPRRTWKNTEQGITYTIDFNGYFASTDVNGVTCYRVRVRDTLAIGLTGAHFIDDKGTDILIINGQSLLQPSVAVYETPASATITPVNEVTAIPSTVIVQPVNF